VVCEEEADVVLTEYSLPSHFINNGTRSNTSWSWFMAAGQESTMINVFDNSSGSDQYAGVWSMEISVKGGKVSCLVERIVTTPPSL
jgi:hypothetical protein